MVSNNALEKEITRKLGEALVSPNLSEPESESLWIAPSPEYGMPSWSGYLKACQVENQFSLENFLRLVFKLSIVQNPMQRLGFLKWEVEMPVKCQACLLN